MLALLTAAWMAQAAAATLLCGWYLRLLRRRQPWPATAPPVLVLVPVRGTQGGAAALDAFLAGLAAQDYAGPWRATFAVECVADPAHAALARFAAARPGRAEVVVAGAAARRGQKVQNLLAALATLRADDAAVVTLDADTVPPPGLLSRLLRPVLTGQGGVASGYRWTLPDGGGATSRLLALADMGPATLPLWRGGGLCWGGATAIGRAALGRLDLPRAWDRALSDDLALSRAARAAGLPIYAPLDVRPPSPAAFGTWRAALAFGVRQYRVLRLCGPRWVWWAALALAALPVAGGAAAAAQDGRVALGCAVAAMALQSARAGLRAAIARRVLPAADAAAAARALRRGAWVQPLVPAFQLACVVGSALGRRVAWAGREYAVDRAGRVAAPAPRPVPDAARAARTPGSAGTA